MSESLAAARPRWPHAQTLVTGALLVAALLTLWFVAPNFFRYNNVVNVLLQTSLLGGLALGMAVVMIVGGIDLSLPANMAFSAIVGTLFMKATGDAVTGSAIMLAVGAGIGVLNGLAVAWLRMIPFVVTLATMTVVSGTSVWVTNSVSISQLPEAFLGVVAARPFFNIPVTVFIVAAVAAALAVVMRSSIVGRWGYAVGINEKAARVARVPVERVVFSSYILAGFLAGATAILLTARLGAASANMGNDGMVLDIVSACVVGGISIYGGSGRVAGALLGALLITVLSNAMNLMGISFYLSLVIKGFVIIAYVAADRRRGAR